MIRKFIFLFGILVSTAALAAPQITVPTIANLVALGPSSAAYGTVNVAGYYAAGDGGGGVYSWFPGSTATADVCVTRQATGVSVGRWLLNLQTQNNRLSDLQCGVKADSSGTSLNTDNTAALQAWSDAAITYGLGEVYCPATTGKRGFASTVNQHVGVIYRGQANTLNPIAGSETNPGSCDFLYTGSGVAFDLQTAVTAVCPTVQSPSLYYFTVEAEAATNAIRWNDPSTANFTDACSSMSEGQSVLIGGVVEGIVLPNGGRSATGFAASKLFNSTIRNNTVAFWDHGMSFFGSDNIDFYGNTLSDGLIDELHIIGETTFGNEFHAHNNNFTDLYTNGSYNIYSSYNSVKILDNYFEDAQFSGGTAAINIVSSGATNDVIENNGMFINPSDTTYWLQESGNFQTLKLDNNYTGGLSPSANFGSGAAFMYSSNDKAIITGGNNPDSNIGIPFFTNTTFASALGSETYPPYAPISGSIITSFDASSPLSLGGTYGPSVLVTNRCFTIPYAAGTASYVTFTLSMPSTASDVAIFASNLANSTSQEIYISDGVTNAQVALSGGANNTWYDALSNDTLSNPTITVGNSDSSHGEHPVTFCAVTIAKH